MADFTNKMNATPNDVDHNRMIALIAEKRLPELGLVRKGKSRLWYKDNGWWISLVEFQPSGWDRGTHLNVGMTWLWNAKGYFSYDQGGRLGSFTKAGNTELFTEEVEKLVAFAVAEISAFRRRFSSIEAVAADLARSEKISIWDHFHAGVSAGLVKDKSASCAEFDKVMSASAHAPWVRELQLKAENFSKAVMFQEDFQSAIEREIAKARNLLKLPALANPLAPLLLT
ncbi:hypothetical protein QA648_24460 (plasmid) [Rhizobium sp. CB3171]|uniref:hypothetical protein n=1 Tax=Rhizobium sp. CB3171 TaxID=3039157 RepID=UPI0024B22071|nr:hypothetical protein [Rhizobium sp. CB3171]WFU06271.1 hypothetical protein QA648_24460 [Rhizobium sp. CB3171]